MIVLYLLKDIPDSISQVLNNEKQLLNVNEQIDISNAEAHTINVFRIVGTLDDFDVGSLMPFKKIYSFLEGVKLFSNFLPGLFGFTS